MTRETLLALAQNLKVIGVDGISAEVSETFKDTLTEKVGNYWTEIPGYAFPVYQFEGVKFVFYSLADMAELTSIDPDAEEAGEADIDEKPSADESN